MKSIIVCLCSGLLLLHKRLVTRLNNMGEKRTQRTCCVMPSNIVLTFRCMAFVLLTASPGYSQWTHQQGDPPSLGDPTPFMSVLSPMTCSDSTQTIPDGGYVKLITSYPWTQVKFDAAATNSGTCLNYLYGNYSSTDNNGILYLQFHPILPDGTPSGYAHSNASIGHSRHRWNTTREIQQVGDKDPGTAGSPRLARIGSSFRMLASGPPAISPRSRM